MHADGRFARNRLFTIICSELYFTKAFGFAKYILKYVAIPE